MLKRNLIANYLGQGWTALMGLAFIPLYVKYLGIEAYGLIGLFAVLQAWLVLLDMGMSPTLSREMARFTGGHHSPQSIRDLLRTLEFITVGMAALIAGGVALSADWIATSWLQAEALPVETVAQAFAIMGWVTALRFAESVYRSSILGLQRQVLFNVVNSALATVRGLGAVAILVWFSPTIQAFFLWQGLLSLITLGILAGITYASLPRPERRAQFSRGALRSVWRFAAGMALGTLTGLLISGVDKILVSKYLTLSELGHYTVAGALVSSLGLLLSPVNQAIYPRFADLVAKNSRDQLLVTFKAAAQLITISLGTLGLILFFFSYEIIFVWTGDLLLATKVAPCLSLLSLATLISSPVWMLYQMQLANGVALVGAQINVVTLFCIVPCFVFFLPIYGTVGAASILVLAACLGLLQHCFYTFSIILQGEFWAWFTESVLLPFIPSLFVVLVGRYLLPIPEARIDILVFICLVGFIALAASVLGARNFRQRIITILKMACDWFPRTVR